VILELEDGAVEQIGGKAAGLAQLVSLGLPVPPAVVLPVGAELTDASQVVARLGEPLAVRSSACARVRCERARPGVRRRR
jgi:hypothetical protein